MYLLLKMVIFKFPASQPLILNSWDILAMPPNANGIMVALMPPLRPAISWGKPHEKTRRAVTSKAWICLSKKSFKKRSKHHDL